MINHVLTRLHRATKVKAKGTTCRMNRKEEHHGRAVVCRRSEEAAPGRGRGFQRRGHPGRDQGAAGIGRRLRGRLPGRADLAPDGRAGRRAGHPGRARHPLREQRQRSDRGGHAGGVGQLSAARRGHLQGHGRHQRRVGRAGQPGLGRRAGRRAHHRGRRLRRGLVDHAGAQPRLRDEVADVAARSPPQPALHRAGGQGRLRSVGGQQHAGDAADAHPVVSRARPVRHVGEPAAGLHRQGRAREPHAGPQPHRPAARELPAREGEGA